MKIKELEDYWEDECGNKWHKDRYSLSDAIKYSMTLNGCYNCKNCYKCTDCKDCFGCGDCTNCRECIECWHCKNLDLVFFGERLEK